MRESLKRIHQKLEDRTDFNHANTDTPMKQRTLLTPDIESQQFMGDLMTSNIFQHQRIPANWDKGK